MRIREILRQIEAIDNCAQLLCRIPSAYLESRMHLVGQVRRNVPGVVLGSREPHFREKDLGTLKDELATFDTGFSESDFLLVQKHDLSEVSYEHRYYKLTDIQFKSSEVVFYSRANELESLRETHVVPEHE